MSLSQRYFTTQFQQKKAEVSRAWYQQVNEEMETILDAMRTDVSTWTQNQIDDFHVTPEFEKFVHEYPEWDHEPFYDAIEAEMNRVTELCRKEAK